MDDLFSSSSTFDECHGTIFQIIETSSDIHISSDGPLQVALEKLSLAFDEAREQADEDGSLEGIPSALTMLNANNLLSNLSEEQLIAIDSIYADFDGFIVIEWIGIQNERCVLKIISNSRMILSYYFSSVDSGAQTLPFFEDLIPEELTRTLSRIIFE